jgi:hypothetical protein
MPDIFANNGDNPAMPSRAPFAIVPHDTNPLPSVPKAIYVGLGGSVALRGIGGAADVTFANVASGQVLDVRAGWVRQTGTTASQLIGLA